MNQYRWILPALLVIGCDDGGSALAPDMAVHDAGAGGMGGSRIDSTETPLENLDSVRLNAIR